MNKYIFNLLKKKEKKRNECCCVFCFYQFPNDCIFGVLFLQLFDLRDCYHFIFCCRVVVVVIYLVKLYIISVKCWSKPTRHNFVW